MRLTRQQSSAMELKMIKQKHTQYYIGSPVVPVRTTQVKVTTVPESKCISAS